MNETPIERITAIWKWYSHISAEWQALHGKFNILTLQLQADGSGRIISMNQETIIRWNSDENPGHCFGRLS